MFLFDLIAEWWCGLRRGHVWDKTYLAHDTCTHCGKLKILSSLEVQARFISRLEEWRRKHQLS